MNIPSFVNDKVVDENGYWTPQWQNVILQLMQLMQQNLSDEGFVMPSQSTANINLLTKSSNGTVLYDSTTDEFKGRVGGVFKTFTLT